MTFVGMSPEAIRSVATGLSNQAESLHNVLARVDSVVQEAEASWKGLDSTNFVNDWSGNHKIGLLFATEAVAQLSQTANQQAEAQDQTSGSGSGFTFPSMPLMPNIPPGFTMPDRIDIGDIHTLPEPFDPDGVEILPDRIDLPFAPDPITELLDLGLAEVQIEPPVDDSPPLRAL